jgi:hypothetical protein
MTTKDERLEQAITFWKGLGHKPGDGCRTPAPGTRTEAWDIVHSDQEKS